MNNHICVITCYNFAVGSGQFEEAYINVTVGGQKQIQIKSVILSQVPLISNIEQCPK